MKIFQCGHCSHPLFFENIKCESCGHICGYLDSKRQMITFAPHSKKLTADYDEITYKYCKNKEYGVCNWLINEMSENEYCGACQLNRTVPDLSQKENFLKWQNLEIAKHHLVYQLQKIGLPLSSKLIQEDGLCFDFVEKRNNPNLMTGHADGVITILLSEADSVQREQMKKQLLEPYRTLIGHLRHEVGHYFWERLISNDVEQLGRFRSIFGDERQNYSEALQQYYDQGPPDNWQESYISKYATSHAWEDWAETWAHYLHIMDMVETAHYIGLKVESSRIPNSMNANSSFDPYTVHDFSSILNTCVPLSFAVNSINRAMGIPDVYPFVITAPVVEKLRSIHHLMNTF